MSFSKDVKSIRQRSLMSQEAFAQAIGVSFTTVNRWETGKSRPSWSMHRRGQRRPTLPAGAADLPHRREAARHRLRLHGGPTAIPRQATPRMSFCGSYCSLLEESLRDPSGM